MAWRGTVVFVEKSFYETSFYNAEDLNREFENIQYLRDQLDIEGYDVDLSFAPISVEMTDFPYVSYINGVRQDLLDLMNGFYTPPDAPAIAINPLRKQTFSYIEANELEQCLQAIYNLLQKMKDSYLYCGTFSCGEEMFL